MAAPGLIENSIRVTFSSEYAIVKYGNAPCLNRSFQRCERICGRNGVELLKVRVKFEKSGLDCQDALSMDLANARFG